MSREGTPAVGAGSIATAIYNSRTWREPVTRSGNVPDLHSRAVLLHTPAGMAEVDTQIREVPDRVGACLEGRGGAGEHAYIRDGRRGGRHTPSLHAVGRGQEELCDRQGEVRQLFRATTQHHLRTGEIQPPQARGGRVPKANSQVRICVDLTRLNQSVKRERHPLPAVDQTLAQLAGAKVFTKLDVNSGFWQIPLAPASSLLTTFITPFGRYCFRRLPFGISSVPEHFQRRMSEALNGLTGTVCMMDDILVHGKTREEHDEHLRAVLQRLSTLGMTLNSSKCMFAQSSVNFLGHVIDSQGIHPDPNKVSVIKHFGTPTNVSDVRRFLGMVNQLSKFSPDLATITQPMRELLVRDNVWIWGEPQERSFQKVKNMLSATPVLALFDPNRETILSADASCYGLGAVLLQRQPTGDVHGKNLTIADALSRAPESSPSAADEALQQETTSYVNLIMENLPATEKRLQEIRQHQEADSVCQKIMHFCRSGWPHKNSLPSEVIPYYPVSGELTVENSLLLRGGRIVIPPLLRKTLLDKIHCSHHGITKCCEMARQSIWWPGLSKELEQRV